MGKNSRSRGDKRSRKLPASQDSAVEAGAVDVAQTAGRKKAGALKAARHPQPRPAARSWHPWFVFGLALLAFSNTATHELVSDDIAAIHGNPLVSQVDVLRIFSTSIWYPNPKLSDLYRPITVLSYALNYAFGGFEPLGYHLLNLVLHAVNSLLVLLLLKRMLEYHLALAAALIFALHPLHTEAVAWVSGRAELLACFFMLSAWIVSLPQETHARSFARTAVASLLFLLALLSKESAVVLIPLIWCFRVIQSQKARASTSLWTIHRHDVVRPADAGLVAAAAVMLVMRKVMLGQIGPKTADTVPFVENPLAFAGVTARVLTSVKLLALYIWKMIWPVSLSADYSYNQIAVFDATEVWFWVSMVAVGLCVWLALRKGLSSWISGGLLATGLAFTLTSNMLFPTGTMFAERLAYVPLLGFSVALAAAFYHPRLASILPVSPSIMLSVVLALFLVRTTVRNPDWATAYTLFKSTARTSPASAKAHAMAGLEESSRNPVRARAHFQEALRIYPKYEQARLGLAQADINLKNFSGAEKALQQALKQNPRSIEALQALAFSYRASGKHQQAVEVSDRILALEKNNGFALAQRGMALEGLKRHSEAIAAYQLAISSGGDSAEVRNRLGALYLQAGQLQPALEQFRAAARLEPDDPLSYFNLASAYRQLGDRPQERQAYVNFLRHWKGDPKVAAAIRSRLEALK